MKVYDAVVIGGGFFGCNVAIYLRQYFAKVLVIEAQTGILQRASYVNQARVHNGYHYPRSLLTALRSKVNFPKFIKDYENCIDSNFEKYYAIGKILSKVNSKQFREFCNRIDVPIEDSPQYITQLFNSKLVEKVFKTQEYAFDAVKLANCVKERLQDRDIQIFFECSVSRIFRSKTTKTNVLNIEFLNYDQLNLIESQYVFNCTYSSINRILSSSSLSTIPLKHEFTEMPLVKVPPRFQNLGITIMCGPFFSIMPFPPKNLHTLSHVSYTPHSSWVDTTSLSRSSKISLEILPRISNYPYMIRDVIRYIPALRECIHIESLWDIKTVLPKSETDDSRPILFQSSIEAENIISILGSKIDNIYDLELTLGKFLELRKILRTV